MDTDHFQVLPMEEREKTYRLRAQERAQREHENAISARQRLEEEVRRRREKAACSAQAPVMPRATYKSLQRTAQAQKRLKEEADNLKREKRREEARHARQRKTSKALAEVMRRIDLEQGRLARRDTGEDAQRKARESRERYRQALKDNKSKLQQVRFIVCTYRYIALEWNFDSACASNWVNLPSPYQNDKALHVAQSKRENQQR